MAAYAKEAVSSFNTGVVEDGCRCWDDVVVVDCGWDWLALLFGFGSFDCEDDDFLDDTFSSLGGVGGS